MLAFLSDVNTMIYLIFDFSVLSDFHEVRLNGCLSFQRFFVQANTRDVYYQVDAHHLWQMQPDCIIFYKLCDIIWFEPSFHKFLGSMCYF